jgi:ubiquitin fusion degradation protein 1
MEFTAPKGCVIVPKWMLSTLYAKEGDLVTVRSVKLSKGQFCKVQPQSKEFNNIQNPQQALETMFTRNHLRFFYSF